MIRQKTKYYTDISVRGNVVRICNRSKGSFLFPGNPQLQIRNADCTDACVNLSDNEIDEIITALQEAKQMVKEDNNKPKKK